MYSRPCRSPTCWLEGRHLLVVVLEMLQDSQKFIENIRQCLRASQDELHLYIDQRHHEVSFLLGDLIVLKVSQIKGSVRFGKQCKMVVSSPGHATVSFPSQPQLFSPLFSSISLFFLFVLGSSTMACGALCLC